MPISCWRTTITIQPRIINRTYCLECVLKPSRSCLDTPPTNDGVGELYEGKIVLCMDFIPYLQAAKQIVPPVGSLDNPAPGFEMWVPSPFRRFFSSGLDVCDVATARGRVTQLRIVVTFVTTKRLAGFLFRRWAWQNDGIEGGTKLVHVMSIGAGSCDGQRDAVRVGEHVPLGTQFAPVRRVFSRLVPPFTGAETVALSKDWKRQSIPWRSS